MTPAEAILARSAAILDAWRYQSREEELEAARWYLCGRLSLETKLDAGSFGDAVYSYEWSRHAATILQISELPELFDSLKPVIGQIWSTSGFPERPFAMLSAEAQTEIKCWFEAEWLPAVRIEDAQVLQQRGVFEEFIKLSAKPGAKAEIPLGPGAAAIVLTVIDDCGPDAVVRSVQRLFKERAERFAQTRGRQLAGQRKARNPLYRLKNLASTRIFALSGYDVRAANQWVYTNQPRNPENNRRIPWFDQKGPRNMTQPLHRDRRDWLSVLNKFTQSLLPLERSQ